MPIGIPEKSDFRSSGRKGDGLVTGIETPLEKDGSGKMDNQPYLSNPSEPHSCGRLAEVTIDGSSLSLQGLVSVARGYSTVLVDRKALQRTKRGRAVLEKLLEEDRVIYGVNTGF